MKPQNIIIAIVFLLIISAFSFSFDKITGYQVQDLSRPEAGIIKDIVKAGEPIKIQVKINEYCVQPTIEFYYNGVRKSRVTYHPSEDDCTGQNFHPCGGIKYCQGNLIDDTMTLNYYTLPSWKVSPGIYKARIRYIEKTGQKRADTPYIDVPFRIS